MNAWHGHALTLRICPPSGYRLKMSLRNSTSGGVVCPNLPVRARLSQPDRWYFTQTGGLNPTSPFKASSSQAQGNLWCSRRYQGPNLSSIIQLEAVDNKTNQDLTPSGETELFVNRTRRFLHEPKGSLVKQDTAGQDPQHPAWPAISCWAALVPQIILLQRPGSMQSRHQISVLFLFQGHTVTHCAQSVHVNALCTD